MSDRHATITYHDGRVTLVIYEERVPALTASEPTGVQGIERAVGTLIVLARKHRVSEFHVFEEE